MRRWGASAALVAVALTAAACSDDDSADPTTVATESSSAPETTVADTTTTTSEATTTSSSTTSSTAPPTTASVDQQKAEIEAAYRDLDAKGYAMLQNPTMDGLDAKVAEIALPGSPYAEALAARVTQLVQDGQYLVPDDPSIERLTVEAIDVTAPGAATVVACQVSNALTVKRADQSPIPGRSIPIANSQIYASRLTETLVQTPNGWRHDGVSGLQAPVWEGADSCPPA